MNSLQLIYWIRLREAAARPSLQTISGTEVFEGVVVSCMKRVNYQYAYMPRRVPQLVIVCPVCKSVLPKQGKPTPEEAYRSEPATIGAWIIIGFMAALLVVLSLKNRTSSIYYNLGAPMLRGLDKVVANMLIVAASLSSCSPVKSEMPGHDTAQKYLSRALSLIQTRALRSAQVNWNEVKTICAQMTLSATKQRETYPAICYALSRLNDNHSVLLAPNGVPIGPKRPENSALTPREPIPAKLIDIKGKHIAVIFLSSWGCSNTDSKSIKFAKSLRSDIARFREKNVAGWVVDLRGNTGGNMWPMLVGIGPILGKGQHGSFQYKKLSVAWFYEEGAAGVDPPSGRHTNFSVNDDVSDTTQLEPVAVLLNRSTVSSGEALAVSFKGRNDTRFFGEQSYGLSNSNESIRLSDGACLMLTTAIDADRNHIDYPHGVDVDERIEQDDIPDNEKNDAVLQSALQWLTLGNGHQAGAKVPCF
ncbi:MAG TPA: S41 family peptidase [Oculatellaceae cyanobacterium]